MDQKEIAAMTGQAGGERVLYVYIPGLNQTVRLIVKASALSGENIPAKHLKREYIHPVERDRLLLAKELYDK